MIININMIKIAFDFIFRPQLFRPTIRVNHFRDIQMLLRDREVEVILTDKDDTISAYREF